MMNLRQFGVGTRLGFGFWVLMLIWLLILIISPHDAGKVRFAFTQALIEADSKLDLVNEMVDNTLATGVTVRNLAVLGQTSVAGELDKMHALQRRYANDRAALLNLAQHDAESRSLADIAALESALGSATNAVLRVALTGQRSALAALIENTLEPAEKALVAALQEHARLQDKSKTAAKAIRIDLDDFNINCIKASALLAAVLGLVFAPVLTRSVTVPLDEASAIARSIASGQLGLPVHVVGNDEFSVLLQGLKDMDAALASAVGTVRSATETMALASHEIAAGNADLSERNESQLNALEHAAAAMKRLAGQMRQNADHAVQANQLAESACGVARSGGAVIERVEQMMTSLKASSCKINDIVGVIDEIAFQTNILALNAAVEAARAGERGHGFAVVAAEVRDLAQRSMAATRQIRRLIAVSADEVDSGGKLVDQAGQTMRTIVGAVCRVTDIMSEIAAASQEQRTGFGNVNAAVVQMKATTGENAALVQHAAAAARSAQGQAVLLLDAVSAFSLNAASQSRVALHGPRRDGARLTRSFWRKSAGSA